MGRQKCSVSTVFVLLHDNTIVSQRGGNMMRKLALTAATILAVSTTMPADAAFVRYTGMVYYGWYDQRGLFTPAANGQSAPITFEADFTPSLTFGGYYFFDTATFHVTIGSSHWTDTLTLDADFPSINSGYFDSQGLCCGGVPAFNFSYNNNQYAGGLLYNIGGAGGNLNFDSRYFNPNSSYQYAGYTYYNDQETQFSAAGGSYRFNADAPSYAASLAPEPASWATMILGMFVLGTTLRRRGARQQEPILA
jgi:hypothetical protein